MKGNGGAFVKIQLLKSNKHYKWVSKKTKTMMASILGKYLLLSPRAVLTRSRLSQSKTRKYSTKVTRTSQLLRSAVPLVEMMTIQAL